MFAFLSRGPRGADGDAGAQGEQGVQGDAGTQGEQGVQGEQGIQGEAGDFNYTDHGDVAAYDKTLGDFVCNSTWYELDLSGIVGAANRLVLISLQIEADSPGKEFGLRTNGYSNNFNRTILRTQVADVLFRGDVWVYTDASGKLQYIAVTANWTTINLAVRGWVE